MDVTIFHADVEWTPFIIANLASSLCTSLVFLVLFRWYRYQFVKPSVIVLATYHLVGQWSGTLLAHEAQLRLIDPWTAYFLQHGFVVLGLLFVTVHWNRGAKEVWERLGFSGKHTVPFSPLAILFGGLVACTSVYLAIVPFSETALAAFITNPAIAMEARETALKLQDSWVAKYSFTLVAQGFGPVLVAAAVYNFSIERPRSPVRAARWLLILPPVFTASFLSAAKGQLAILVLAAAVTLAWKVRLALTVRSVLFGACLVLLPAVLVTMRLASVADDFWTDEPIEILDISLRTTLDRIFLSIGKVNLWYMDFAQRAGPVGISGVPKIAALFGEPSIDLPNLIGLTYAGEIYAVVVDSISANTGYLYAFYVYGSLWGLVLAVLLLTICDSCLFLVKRLPDVWLPVALGSNTLGALTFALSDFLTSLFTHGLMTRVVLICMVVAMVQVCASERWMTETTALRR